jgi:cytochrome P450
MDITNRDDVAFFDILDPAFRFDATEVRAAAAAGWWARTPIGLAVLRYQECLELLRDRRLRPASMDLMVDYGVSDTFADWLQSLRMNLEGEPHRRQRRLVNAAFTQRSVDLLRPFMQAKAHELIDGFIDDGGCEFMTAFAKPYPAWVIAELLGVPPERFDAFFGWAKDLILGFSPAVAAERDRADAALVGLYACCDELMAQCRENPNGDVISALITAAGTDDDLLTADELRILFSSLVFAGQGTTSTQLGLAMMTFVHHLDQWRLLAKRPELASTAVEEIMRVNSVVTGLARVATEAFTFHGVDIAAGTHIMLFIAAAHTEPDTFGGVSFDITMRRKQQLSFGGGVHYCLGARLARAEMCEALPILASRLGDIALAEPMSVTTFFGVTGPGLTTLPLRFTRTASLRRL